MLNRPSLFLLFILAFLTSCAERLEEHSISFENAFPKQNKNLAAILGDTLYLKTGADTLQLTITSTKQANLIVDAQSSDTLFYGTVARYRGLYYFSQALNDTSYAIHAVKISDNLIYGLTTAWQQADFIRREARQGKHPKLLTFMAPDSSTIRLKPDKGECRKLFGRIIEATAPDTILYKPAKTIAQRTLATTAIADPEAYELIDKVYPNPITDLIQIELQQQPVQYQLTDMNGNTMATGQFNKKHNTLNAKAFKAGLYFLTLTATDLKQKESVKLLKR